MAMPECAHRVKHRPRYHSVLRLTLGDQQIVLCFGCYSNVLCLLEAYNKAGKKPNGKVLKRFTSLERQLAQQLWECSTNADIRQAT